jgi:hypothetical protein
VLTPADHTIMREGFKRCSILEHYQPSAGNIPLPTADDISVEIARMGDWFLNIKQRQESLPKP